VSLLTPKIRTSVAPLYSPSVFPRSEPTCLTNCSSTSRPCPPLFLRKTTLFSFNLVHNRLFPLFCLSRCGFLLSRVFMVGCLNAFFFCRFQEHPPLFRAPKLRSRPSPPRELTVDRILTCRDFCCPLLQWLRRSEPLRTWSHQFPVPYTPFFVHSCNRILCLSSFTLWWIGKIFCLFFFHINCKSLLLRGLL